MSLDHAILGFVNEAPRSGYDLKKAFDRTVNHFWPANQSQIYQTLARLRRDGMVEVQVIQQEGKPNRKVYSITDRGLMELRHWLSTPLPLDNLREVFLVQFFWADAITLPELVSLLEDRIAKHRERLDYFHQRMRRLDENPPRGEWDKVLQPLIVDAAMTLDESWLAWLERALARVRGLPPARRGG